MRRLLISVAVMAGLAIPAATLGFADGDQVKVHVDGDVLGRLADGRNVVQTDGGVLLLPDSALDPVPTPSPSPTATPTPSPTASPTPSSTPSPAADADANLWIDPSGGTCNRQPDGGPYSDAAACSSIQTAVAACTPGDTIRMKAGTYGSQSISTDRTSPGCTVIGERSGGENLVTTGSITPKGDWLTIKNITSTGSLGFADVGVGQPHDLRFENVNTDGINFWDGGSNIAWVGGDVGPTSLKTDGALVMQGCPNALSNVTIDGVRFHDVVRDGTADQHTEVVRIDDNTSDITVRNSTFEGSNNTNSSMVLIGSKGSNCSNTRSRGVTWENNFFAADRGNGLAINFGGGGAIALCANMRMAYNTFAAGANPWAPGNCANSGTATVVGNLGPKPACGAATYDNNVWVGGTCGGSDLSVSSPGLTGDGFHLSGSSAARGNGSPTDCPATDHDGEDRPQPTGSTCDAGADEVG